MIPVRFLEFRLTVRISRGNRRSLFMRRSWHHAGSPLRPRRLYRVLAESPERRQAGDLHRRQPCAESRRLSARLAAAGGATCIPRGPLDRAEVERSRGATLALYDRILDILTTWVDGLDPAKLSTRPTAY
jgi:hypothetical protein